MCIVVQPESSGADNVSDVCGIVFVLARQSLAFLFSILFLCVVCGGAACSVCVRAYTA